MKKSIKKIVFFPLKWAIIFVLSALICVAYPVFYFFNLRMDSPQWLDDTMDWATEY